MCDLIRQLRFSMVEVMALVARTSHNAAIRDVKPIQSWRHQSVGHWYTTTAIVLQPKPTTDYMSYLIDMITNTLQTRNMYVCT
jgi:hypothetical protein